LDVKFCEVPGSTELGNKFRDEGEGVSVLDGYSVQCAIVLDHWSEPSFFLIKNTGAAIGDLEGWIHLVCRFFSRKASNSACSNKDKE